MGPAEEHRRRRVRDADHAHAAVVVRHYREVVHHVAPTGVAWGIEPADENRRRVHRDIDHLQAGGAGGDVDPVGAHGEIGGVAGRVDAADQARVRRVLHVDDRKPAVPAAM